MQMSINKQQGTSDRPWGYFADKYVSTPLLEVMACFLVG